MQNAAKVIPGKEFTMKIIVAVLMAMLAAGISYATLNISICNSVKLLRPADPEEVYESVHLSKVVILTLVACVVALSFAAASGIVRQTSDVIGNCKMMIALLCMVGAACVDFRERRIPNIFPIVMALSGIVLLITSVILQQNGAGAYITGSVVSCVVCVVFLMLASALTKQGIGAGDIKLIGALALLTGVYAVIGTIFFSSLICGIVAVVALITRKMSVNNSLPFGPFLFVGFVMTVLTGNF